jgi:ElaB/YqjD/DUF883 family membrane-anchored ribosome-binding protein
MANGELKPPAKSSEEVRAEIERAREQIQASVVALRQEVAEVVDWREWVRARPALCIGAAFAIGFYLGSRR